MELLQQIEHRPYPVPVRRSAMGQTWYELLFAHWPIAPEIMRRLVPANLELDTFEGQAWVGVVPFRMRNIRFFGLTSVPFASRFEELNVRTYVKLDNRPGVFFFSLDASNPVAVEVARQWYHLPYFNARMKVTRQGDKIAYSSRRVHFNSPRPAEFEGEYGPTGPVYLSKPGTLESWLTERYCLYAVDKRQRVYRGEIHHKPWPLQPAYANFKVNTVAQSHGLTLPDTKPLLHYAERLDVLAWSLQRIRG